MDRKAIIYTLLIYSSIVVLTIFIRFSPGVKIPEYINLGFVSEVIVKEPISEGNLPKGGEEGYDTFSGNVPVKIKEPVPGLPPEEKTPHIGKEETPSGHGGEEKSYKIQGEIASRKLIKFVKPEYPPGMNEEAQVRLSVTVDSLGYVKRVDVLKTGGYKFDRSAISAVMEWRFMPMRGIPEQKGVVIILYRLKK